MHAKELGRYFRVTLVSDSLPVEALGDSGYCVVESRRFNYLRRFCHVPNALAFVRAARRRLSALHEADPIHAVICHGHDLAWFAGVPFQRATGVPLALFVHADIFDRPPGTYDFAQAAFYRYATVRAYRNVDPIIAVSPGMANAAVKAGAPASAVNVVPNGIDPGEIGLTDSEEHQGQPDSHGSMLSLLYVGRLAIEKGVDTLLEACRLLTDAALPYRLRIVGSGPLEASCRSLAAALDLTGQVEFVGAIARPGLGAMYRWSNIVCVPSLSEPFGLVALEALAAGRPVIASRVGGLPFIVEDGKTGALVPPASAKALFDAIRLLAANPETLKAMAANALATRSRFGWRKIGEELRDVLDSAMRAAVRS